MQLTGFLPVVRRWWRLLLAATVLAGLVGYLIGSQVAPRYEARAQLLVGPINTDIDTLRASGQLAQTYAELVTNRPLLVATAKELKLPLAPGALKTDVSATANDITRVLTIRVRNDNPVLAARIANTLAVKLARLSTQGTSPSAAGQLQVVNTAQPPGAKVGPKLSVIVPLAALAGLLGTLTLVLIADYFRDTIRSGSELAEVTQAAFLGSIGGVRRRSGGRDRPLVVEARPRSHAAASYRLLAAKIGSSDGERPLRSLLVVGTEDGPGSGELAANLAAVLSSGGRRVTFIDLDGDQAGLRLEERSDANELLAQSDEILGQLERWRSPGAGVPPGGGTTNGDVLEAGRAKGLLERLLKKADLIVLGGAPVDRSPGTLVWARTADATLLVADRDRTKRDSVSNAVQSLRLVGATLIGTVMSEPSERSLETVLGRLARQGRREA